MCVFIKLHITAQSGPVMLAILQYAARIDPPKGGSIILITKISDQTQQCVCVCVCVVIPLILDIRLVDVPARVTLGEGHTGFLIYLPSAVLAYLQIIFVL